MENDGLSPVFDVTRHCAMLKRTSISFELEVLVIVEVDARFHVYLVGRQF